MNKYTTQITRNCYDLRWYYLIISIFYVQILKANSDRDSIVTNAIIPPIPSARFVRIRPQEYRDRPSLRFEILGCKPGNG